MMKGFNRSICLAPIFFLPSVRSCFNDRHNTRASFSEPKFPESIAIQGQLTLFLALGKRSFFLVHYMKTIQLKQHTGAKGNCLHEVGEFKQKKKRTDQFI